MLTATFGEFRIIAYVVLIPVVLIGLGLFLWWIGRNRDDDGEI